MIGDAGEAKKRKRSRESEAAFRAKNRFWRATMRREAGGHKNFFIAKNLRVHAARFQPASTSRRSVERVPVNRCSNEKNACGTVAFCNPDNRLCQVFLRNWHRRANVSWCYRSTRGTRSRTGTSTLP
jgi:hypothetical protein